MTRYTRSHGYHNVMRSHRYRPILIILLVLLAAFLIFKAAGVGGINEGNYEAQRNTRLRSEVQHAVSSVNSLSRLGASSTSAMYGEIGRLYDQSTFDAIYAIIEEYDAKLASGQNISDTLTSLSEVINELSDMTTVMLDGTQTAVSET